jgi:hypothetical protein
MVVYSCDIWGGVIAAPVGLVGLSNALTDAIGCLGQIVRKSQQILVKNFNVGGVGDICQPGAFGRKK